MHATAALPYRYASQAACHSHAPLGTSQLHASLPRVSQGATSGSRHASLAALCSQPAAAPWPVPATAAQEVLDISPGRAARHRGTGHRYRHHATCTRHWYRHQATGLRPQVHEAQRSRRCRTGHRSEVTGTGTAHRLRATGTCHRYRHHAAGTGHGFRATGTDAASRSSVCCHMLRTPAGRVHVV